MTITVQIDGNKITDWDSFHDHCAAVLGFPGFYGRNMDAWCDCMTYLDEMDAGMTSWYVAPGDVLVLSISGASDLKKRCPEIFEAIVECSAFVNYRRIKKDLQAVLALSFYV